MSGLAERVATLTGVAADACTRLAGGDLSEVLRVPRDDGHVSVAKGGPLVAVEAAMLRALGAAGMPVPTIEAEGDDTLILGFVENDGVLSPRAWASIGAALKMLHAQHGETYGWPSDYALGTVTLDNRETRDWRGFWVERRLLGIAAVLDRPWRVAIEGAADRMTDLLPRSPPASLLHGDLWIGNVLVRDGALAVLIDPACIYGHAEVDLAMMSLFDIVPDELYAAYGPLDPGWEARRPVYQLFPALVHLRLFGDGYARLVQRLLDAINRGNGSG